MKSLDVEVFKVVDNNLNVIHQPIHVNKQLDNNSSNCKLSKELLASFCHLEKCVCKKYLSQAVAQYAPDKKNVSKVNLDVSSMIALVSNQCHGSCGFCGFDFTDGYLRLQAEEEKTQGSLLQVFTFLLGKELYACDTSIEVFKDIIAKIAGTNELKRAKKLIKILTRVEDQASEIALKFTKNSKINERSIRIFSTGDALKAVTLTSNASFIRSARQSGIDFVVFMHPPRSLSEQKEVFTFSS